MNTICGFSFSESYTEQPNRVLGLTLVPLLGIAALLPVVASLVWGLSAVIPSNQLVEAYLAGIAGVQASVLAIGVSVLLLGVELVTSRHSSQFTSIILNNGVLRSTSALIVISIGTDLWLLFNAGGLYSGGAVSVFHGVLLYYTAPLGLLSGYCLYLTIIEGVERGTSEGILSTLKDNYSVEKFVKQADKSVVDDTVLHPTADIYFIISDSISESDAFVSVKFVRISAGECVNLS